MGGRVDRVDLEAELQDDGTLLVPVLWLQPDAVGLAAQVVLAQRGTLVRPLRVGADDSYGRIAIVLSKRLGRTDSTRPTADDQQPDVVHVSCAPSPPAAGPEMRSPTSCPPRVRLLHP